MRADHLGIYNRLKKGKTLEGLGLGKLAGRWLVESLSVPQPEPKGLFQFKGLTFQQNANVQILKKVRWENMHFSYCDFSDLGFFGLEMTNCHFTNCRCQEIGFWDANISDCEFVACDMTDAAFGGVDMNRPRPNRYSNVIFQGCDFRGSAHSCEAYDSCSFINCRLEHIDFEGAVFSDCIFEGKLQDVMFKARSAACGPIRTNRLSGCDFRRTELVACAFVNIDLNPDLLPNSEDLIVLWNGPADWAKWGEQISAAQHEGRSLFLKHVTKDSGAPTVTNRSLLLSAFSTEEVEMLVKIGRGQGRPQ